MNWNELPGFEEVHDFLRKRAALSAEIRVLELKIKLLEAEISVQKPRNTAARVIGYDDETGAAMREMRNCLAYKCGELDEVDAEIKFFDYRKDIIKTLAYRERM